MYDPSSQVLFETARLSLRRLNSEAILILSFCNPVQRLFYILPPRCAPHYAHNRYESFDDRINTLNYHRQFQLCSIAPVFLHRRVIQYCQRKNSIHQLSSMIQELSNCLSDSKKTPSLAKTQCSLANKHSSKKCCTSKYYPQS